MAFFVYILRNRQGRFYIGQTSDVELRLRSHNEKRSFWTKSRGPWVVVHTEEFPTRAAALARERSLKGLKNRQALERLISRDPGTRDV
ncbi:MAG: GIY-YIG nuclease family protein [Dehalococcoidia bacterium]|nr:GIY-YIG nuclease family protein [Dehalococcoidia bacterium]